MAHERHATCIEACVDCAFACEHCAMACLREPDVQERTECIRLARDCAEICWTAAAFLSRDAPFSTSLCRLCEEICIACGRETGKSAAGHCQRCADMCASCAEECHEVAGSA